MELAGMNALVTGGSRGIGRAICVELASAGATVAVHYNANPSAADETLSSLTGNGHFTLQADLAKPEDCERLAVEASTRFERVHLLVNNAGIYGELRFATTDYAAWQAAWVMMLQTNLLSAVNLSYLIVRHYLSVGGGKIINVASRAGFRGEKKASHYGASKAAMINFTRSMANELAGAGVFVAAVAPGWVETEMTTEHLEKNRERIIRDIPLGRVAQPKDVANAVRFLASPGSEYLHGVTIDVNGGSYFH